MTRDEAGAAPATPRVVQLTLSAAILGGLLARWWGLGHRPLWDDEAFTYFMTARGWQGTMEALRWDSSPPLYYLLVGAITRVLGDGEAALRTLSAAAGSLLIGAGAWVAARCLQGRSVLVCAALLAASPVLLYASQEARFYCLLSLLVLVSAWCLWVHAHDPRPSTGVGAAVAGLAAMFVHYPGAYLVPFSCVALALRTRRRWAAASWPALVLVGAVLILLPLARLQKTAYPLSDFRSGPYSAGLALPVSLLRSTSMLGNGSLPEGWVKQVGLAAFLLALIGAVFLTIRQPGGLARVAFPLALGVTLMGVWQVGGALGIWPTRDNFLPVLVPAACLTLVAPLGISGRATAFLPSLIGLAVMASGSYALLWGNARTNPDFRGAAAQVAAAGGGTVLLARPWGDLACYGYYARRPGTLAIHGVAPDSPTPEARVVGLPLKSVEDAIREPGRLWILGKTTGTGFAALEAAAQATGRRAEERAELRGVRLIRMSQATGRETEPGGIVHTPTRDYSQPSTSEKGRDERGK